MSRFLNMAVPPYFYHEPKSSNTLIIVVAVIGLIGLILVGAIVAFVFYSPNILRSSSSSRSLQDPRVTSATLTCTGICNLTGQFYSDYTSLSRPIASNGPGIWMLERPSNAIYWDIEWRFNLTSTGSSLWSESLRRAEPFHSSDRGTRPGGVCPLPTQPSLQREGELLPSFLRSGMECRPCRP